MSTKTLEKTQKVVDKDTVQVPVYDMNGKKVETMKLPEIFNWEIKEHLVHEAMLYQRFNNMISTAHTKTRTERRGGGAKPWRQKGTGRARVGSIRSPIWRKGGVVFGPTNEKNYTIRMPKKERRIALFSVLTDKVKNKKLIILKNLKLSGIKTKKMEEVLSRLKISGTVLMVIDKKDEKIEKSSRNLPYLKLLKVQNLNIIDLLTYEFLLITKDGVQKIAEIYKKF